MAGIHFLHIAVDFAQAALPLGKIALGFGHNDHHQHQSQQRNRQRDQRQPPFRYKHHNQAAHKLGGGADNGGQAVGQGLLQGGNVVGNTA